ncbi:uncharacterized protein pcare2 [Salarias fasciatus]|uniref:uncharacterized protein pcare2 n=1 Tax=Salarias fasciatus TaxID=181472 RepID=UPI001176CD12|nr:uncharacterized protein LOC115401504 [Salarias fasciatus]
MDKRKKNKGKKRSAEKKRKSSAVHTKVDFPPHMVRAHQAAYDFLNPNISKYETLLGLLDQAAQTHLSLQPMMSAVVLRFEEINQALEEMAEEGELMLKEHGDCMALPSGMTASGVRPAKPSTDTACPSDPPPDLLQQMLQHSTEKMRQVGGSVQALGDTSLEEAVEYFSSVSRLLVEKLQAKQAAEQRLAQVLARVECAAMRKSNPEDSALHSEDSGIGGENESLTGSERHRRHRGSAGSGSCGSGVNNPIPNLANLRFPSPPVFRPQSASSTSSRPSSPRTVTRASDRTPEEIIPSVSFRDARSVFCRNEPQTPQAPGSCVLPRRWGDGSRGRAASRETDAASSRRTQSEQRPGVTAQLSRDRSSASSQGLRGNESFNQRPDGALMTAHDGQ